MSNPYKTPENETDNTTQNKPYVESDIFGRVLIAIGLIITAIIVIQVFAGLEVDPLMGMANSITILGALTLLFLIWSAISASLLIVPTWRVFVKYVVPVPIVMGAMHAILLFFRNYF